MSLLGATIRFLANARPLDVAVVDGLGDQLTGFDSSRPANATITSVGASVTSVTIAAANAARRQLIVVNDGNKTLYLAFAATATTAAYTYLVAAGQTYTGPVNGYTGIVTGIWSAANGNAIVTEVTT